MSEPEPIEEVDTSGLLDAPNQQVVRPDGSGPADEGEGGTVHEEASAGNNSMTKDELLAEAQRLGVSPANAGMTKDELQAGIDAKLAEEPTAA
jgi:hypothetical protein